MEQLNFEELQRLLGPVKQNKKKIISPFFMKINLIKSRTPPVNIQSMKREIDAITYIFVYLPH